MTDIVVAERPTPGTPRPYEFPPFERHILDNGLSLLVVDLPARELISALLVIRSGAVDEEPADAGATVLAARALAEGTQRYSAIELVEATERLGASLHAEASWDGTWAGVDVPAERLGPALALVAELVAHPTFPSGEVQRLREERLNDLLQARADTRRRADEAFAATIYTGESPYHRPSGGTRETVSRLDPARLRAAWERGFDPRRMTLVVAGDLRGIDVLDHARRLFGGLEAAAVVVPLGEIRADSAVGTAHVRVLQRPGAVQTEIRVGHPGAARRIPDYHAVSVMSTILGGLFTSRLNLKLREEKGYTYGAGAGFDLRRGPGPFVARAAVNTDVTVPALIDLVGELRRIREAPVTEAELRAAKDFLIGVFPLRFETAGPVVGALSGLVVHDLPDDELARYRPAIEAVSAEAVLAAARAHIDPEHAAVVLVGDVERFGPELEGAGLGPIVIERDDPVASESDEG
ncbi:MAG TPA: pitrilysin family protein [Candidatus Limnocylindrales bacterium]